MSHIKYLRNNNINALIFVAVLVLTVHVIEINREVKVNRNKTKVNNDKIILSWHSLFDDPYYYFKPGSDGFKDKQCEYTNCFITDDKFYLPQHEFDAILYHGFEFYEFFYGKPKYRSAEQYYVFVNLESVARSQLPKRFMRFYNITMTYRLDSDIPWPYISVEDANGFKVAPDVNPKWIKYDENIKLNNELINIIENKTKKIAWFVSNCKSTNNRDKYVKSLQKYIQVDIYGYCGELKCDDRKYCDQMISNDYYFYLAFENSHCHDYITEKILRGLNNNAIPIFYGLVNLSSFLPPHSYIDASVMSPKQLAELLDYLIINKEQYYKYFWWKEHYLIEYGHTFKHHPFCRLCKILNEGGSYSGRDIVEWWNKDQCAYPS